MTGRTDNDSGAEGGPFRLVSFNVRRGRGLFRWLSPRRTLAAIVATGADAVALQEVDNGVTGDGADLLCYLARGLGMVAVEGYVRPQRSGGRYGNALLLAAPPLSVRRHDLTVAGREPRGALEATIDFRGSRLTVVVTHLGLRRSERREQKARLADILASIDGPLALAGDFNEWRRNPAPDALDGIFSVETEGGMAFQAMTHGQDARATVPTTPTYPALFPFLALDRIRVRPPLSAALSVPASCLARRASDHRPLLAEIRP